MEATGGSCANHLHGDLKLEKKKNATSLAELIVNDGFWFRNPSRPPNIKKPPNASKDV